MSMPWPQSLASWAGTLPADAHVAWHLEVGCTWPPWALTLLGLALAAITVWVLVHGALRVSPKLAWALAILRLVGLTGLGLLILQPELRLDVVRDSKTPILLLIDRTASMRLGASGSTSRGQRLDTLLGDLQPSLDQLRLTHTVRRQEFSGERETDLNAAIAEAAASAQTSAAGDAASGPPAAIVLFSDGADSVDLRPGGAPLPPGERLPAAALATLQSLGVPVSTVAIDDGGPSRDLRVDKIGHDAFAFIKNSIAIDVFVGATGYSAGTMTVVLEQAGAPVGQVVLPRHGPGASAQVAHFKVTPNQVGEALFTARIACEKDELTCANNGKAVLLRVVRDKLRVLHVAGRPSWDERFLREALKANPNLDLISFFILRTPESDAQVPESELALIPFPVERLFTQELKNFDVVLFQNFDARPFGMQTYLPNLAQAIRGGLGFMMLGGADSFEQGGYANSALQPVLPTLPGMPTLVPGPLPLQLTGAGARHSLMDLWPQATDRAAGLAALPRLTDINRLGTPAPGATVLATAQAPGGAALPLLVARDVGAGRTLALASDALWHWRVAAPANPQAGRAYARFWAQALRWLAHDPDTDAVMMTLGKRELGVMEAQEVTLCAQDAGLAAGKNFEVTTTAAAFVNGPNTSALPPTLRAAADGNGCAAVHLPGLGAGIYRIAATLTGAQGPLTAVSHVIVQPQGSEQVRVAADAQLLAAISQATGGKAVSAAGASGLLHNLPVRGLESRTVLGTSRFALWDNVYLLACIVAAYGAEWLLRRRAGLR